LAFVSSAQIFIASSDDLPFAASGPVSDMPKPIFIGSAANADPAISVNKIEEASRTSCCRNAPSLFWVAVYQ
jgi:hypothetical protein